MKLHKLLLTAALCLSVGIVFAQGNGNGNNGMNGGQAKQILQTIELKTQNSYSWDTNVAAGPTNDLDKESILEVTMIRMNGNGNGNSNTGWSYLVGGYRENNSKVETALSNGVLSTTGVFGADFEGLTEEQISAINFYAKEHGVYNFQVSFGTNETIQSFGLIGTVEDVIESVNNTTDKPNENKFYTLGDTNILYYGSPNNFPNNGALFLVSAYTTYREKEPVPFGTPLPTPVTTLLIALGFGAALMIYRNRKAKA